MKRKIFIALVAMTAVSLTTVSATNPFTDVDTNHWSYASFNKLASDGIIDGYGDGTLRGERTMTRYEMAQIVAKALARSDKLGAEQKTALNKLAAEYGAELNNLGVRVGSLEHKVGTVKISGEARIRWLTADDKSGTMPSGARFDERLRLYMRAAVNENTSFNGRIAALENNTMGETGHWDRLMIQEAAFTSKNIFGINNSSATAGRYSQYFLTTGYWGHTTADGIKFAFGNKMKLTIGYADFGSKKDYLIVGGKLAMGPEGLVIDGVVGQSHYAILDYAMPKTYFAALHLKERTDDNRFNVYGFGVRHNITNGVSFFGDYVKNTLPTDKPTAYNFRLMYRGATPRVVGSWGAAIEYLRFEPGASVATWSEAMVRTKDLRAWNIGFMYTVSKNMVFHAMHQVDAKVISAQRTGLPADYKLTRADITYFF